MEREVRWVARLFPLPATTVEALLLTPLNLDVWERHDDYLVVAASDAVLSELERRRLAAVERFQTVEDFIADARTRVQRDKGGKQE